MDYSELAEALQDGDDVKVNKILEEIIPRLVRFLEIHMGASTADAEDCVQHSLERVLKVLREDGLNNTDRILTYLMSTCRNNYLKEQEKIREVNYDHVPRTEFHKPNQVKSILDRERKQILKRCIEELKEMYRTFIEYWFEHPDSEADMVASHFGISVNNVWTRKHRVIKKLNQCYKRKINQ
ncbi:RNA polymerase sigma factor [Halalkalibaculum sp. DA384]|uniref:RNA polymerase sigma factor n=1 Tax=Halalkalibaculum sp. DA384 TaxID=3373606 RepID=UPI003754A5E2